MRNRFDFADQVTLFFSRAIEALMAGNPIKTALGFFIGLLIKGCADFAAQIWEWEYVLPWYIPIPGGVLFMHRKSLLKDANKNEDIESAFEYLRKAQEEGNFTEAEKRRQYRQLVQLVFEKYEKSNSQQTSNPPPKDPTPAT